MFTFKNAGTLCAIAAYVIWGLYPLYFCFLKEMPLWMVIFGRMSFSSILLIPIAFGRNCGHSTTEALRSPRAVVLAFLAGAFIAGNWFLYQLAVNLDRVLDVSLAYFVTPIINVAIGAIVFKERLGKRGMAALALAFSAMMFLSAARGQAPWIAVSMGTVFAMYCCAKKFTKLPAAAGVFMENILSLPAVAACIVIFVPNCLDIWTNQSYRDLLLLLGCGLITVIPLCLFSAAAKSIPLSKLGFLQYTEPTLNALVAMAFLSQYPDQCDILAFAAVWIAIFLACGPKRRNSAK